jgi:hypothetical protein
MEDKTMENKRTYGYYNESAKRATMKYMAEHRDTLKINIPKGLKNRYKTYAESRGTSLTALIMDLIEADIDKHGWEEGE